MKLQLPIWLVIVAVLLTRASLGSDPETANIEFFEKKIRPILVQHCYECHAGDKDKGGLRLDSRAGWSVGGDTGPAIVPGNPDESLLIQAIRYGGDYEMPPKGKLPDTAIRDLEEWVRRGAHDPRADAVARKAASGIDLQAGRNHWSYRPVIDSPIPQVLDTSWPQTAIDFFILSRLEAAGLAPAQDADRTVLIRRLYYDLHGLPPSIEEVDAFLADSSQDAYERLVDRLLASPRFGERWGRHWLDVARYAESMTLRGFVFKEAWRYRDYVIQSFNADHPYDQFLREQIAGDLIPAQNQLDRERNLVATSFLALGNTNLEEQDKRQLEMDVVDEQLDVIGKGILAQTITCARCHDHKFDPIPQRDYYALAGILKNTQALEHANVSKWVEAPLPVDPSHEAELRRHEELLAGLQKQLQGAKEAVKAAAKQTGDVESALVIAASELAGVVVDDEQAKKVGDWKISQFTKRYVGQGYVHDMRQGQGEKTLTFVPDLPRDGRYEVRFSYSPADSRATSVPVTIFSADGESTVHVDETEPPPIDGRFVSLGQFRFERAGQSFVIVSNAGVSGYVTADAVQFLPVEMVTTDVAKAATKEKEGSATAKAQLTAAEVELKRLEAEMKKQQAAKPYRPMAMTVLERKEIANARINIRGVVHNLGEEVPRGFLQVCNAGETPAMPADQSGRMELAAWLSAQDNPLTSRVMVNRAWKALFGTGIVSTVDNFGLTGEKPTHPELLDYLAYRFKEREWSLKDLVRTIVLSRTYRQSSKGSATSHQVDPENRLLANQKRKRLDAECLRDAMLMVSGDLRWEAGGAAFSGDLASDYGFQHAGLRRSVYEPVFRNSLPAIFEAFDFADPSLVTGQRSTSTVAPQALFMLNHPFVIERSQGMAKRMMSEYSNDDATRIEAIFRSAVGRPPTESELKTAMEFIEARGRGGDDATKLKAWSQLCQSLFATIDFRYVD